MHAVAANNKPKIHHHSFAFCFVSFHFFLLYNFANKRQKFVLCFSFRCFLFCYYSPEMLPFLHFKLLWFHCTCIFAIGNHFRAFISFSVSRSAQRARLSNAEIHLQRWWKKTNDRDRRRITEPNYTKAKTLENINFAQCKSCDCLPPVLFRFVYFFSALVGAKNIFYISTLNNYMASVRLLALFAVPQMLHCC